MQAKILIAKVSISATNLLLKSLSKLRLPFGLNFLGASKADMKAQKKALEEMLLKVVSVDIYSNPFENYRKALEEDR